ncbi:MAG: prepilin-type N-terminal cleavage/methylation domain-containing protein [bacterium]
MKKTTPKPKKNAGFTLIEVVVAFGITIFVAVVFGNYIINSYKTIDFVNGFNQAVESAKNSVSIMNKEIREADGAKNGLYVLGKANEQEIIFYSDADNDNETEKIRYYLDGTALKKEVTEAGALPYNYSETPEVGVLSENVENGVAAIFTYYDANNNLIANPSASINQIRLVHTYLEINTESNRAPANYAIETSTNIRNLKKNNASLYSNYVCGNGIIEGGEQCDCVDDENCSLAELDNETCKLFGYDRGDLGCSSCNFNTVGCINAECGNNVIEGAEVCDGSVDGATCASMVDQGYTGGTLSCYAPAAPKECRYDTSLCTTCGSGQTLRHNGTTWIADSNLYNNGTNIGIGTTAPSKELEVAGTAKITGDLEVGGKFNASGADLAEEFASVNNLEEGTVVIMGDDGYKSIKPCDSAYDKKVAGVVSDNASIIMGRINGSGKEIIAIKGVVAVKATNKNGNIKKGNLLTTSDISGRAMRAAEIKTGTIIGKALENCDSEYCDVKTLINLR